MRASLEGGRCPGLETGWMDQLGCQKSDVRYGEHSTPVFAPMVSQFLNSQVELYVLDLFQLASHKCEN